MPGMIKSVVCLDNLNCGGQAPVPPSAVTRRPALSNNVDMF